jgi:hypothetical protein
MKIQLFRGIVAGLQLGTWFRGFANVFMEKCPADL